MLHVLTGARVVFSDATGAQECRVVHAFEAAGVTHLHVQRVQDAERADRLRTRRLLKHVERILAAGEWCDLFTGRIFPLSAEQREHYERERESLLKRLEA